MFTGANDGLLALWPCADPLLALVSSPAPKRHPDSKNTHETIKNQFSWWEERKPNALFADFPNTIALATVILFVFSAKSALGSLPKPKKLSPVALPEKKFTLRDGDVASGARQGRPLRLSEARGTPLIPWRAHTAIATAAPLGGAADVKAVLECGGGDTSQTTNF